jgi:hypothetical protein
MIASHRIASHRIASHRIASHRIASHRLYCLRLQSLSSTNLYKKTKSSSLTKFLRLGRTLLAGVLRRLFRLKLVIANKINIVKKLFSRWKNAAFALFISAGRLFYIPRSYEWGIIF